MEQDKIAQNLIEQRNQILDREISSFLEEYNLPKDKEQLYKLGYVLIQNIYCNPKYPTQTDETFEFQLCKIIKEKKMVIRYDLEII